MGADERFSKGEASGCCGLIKKSRCCIHIESISARLILADSKITRVILFFEILWAELSDLNITIHYAQKASKRIMRVTSINYKIQQEARQNASLWVSMLLHLAYSGSQPRKRIKVLVNPFGGQGKAEKLYTEDIEPILTAAHCQLDVERTQFQGHAVEIAEKLDIDAFDVVAACSGDGLPHEIFNGLGKRRDARRALSKLAVAQLPCGSGNAMSLNLNGTNSASMAALAVVKGIRTPLDLMSITQGDQRTLSFLSQSFGIIAECDLDTDNLRWMGSARFTWGYLVRLLGKKVYPCDIAVKVEVATKPQIRDHYRNELNNRISLTSRDQNEDVSSSQNYQGLPRLKYGTVNDPLPSTWPLLPAPKLGNFWTGNMPYMAPDTNIFPASLPCDGLADIVTVDGDVSRGTSIRTLLAAQNDNFFDLEHVSYRKISGYRLIPKLGRKGGCVSIDGERFPCEPWQAEVHRGLGTILTKRGRAYEAKGVLG